MKHHYSSAALAVCFGAAGFVLRLIQDLTGFEPDTGLPVSGNIPAVLLPILLVLAAASLYLLTRRTMPREASEQTFAELFRLDDPIGLSAVLAGACFMAASGILELIHTADSAVAVSADGMEIIAADAGAGGSGVVIGVLSAAAGVCLAAGTVLCRKTNAQPLIFLAVPVCLLARLILVYRLRSANPVLADYYLEILGLMLLILAFYRLSGFAVQAGKPGIFTFYSEYAFVLALSMLPDSFTPSKLLMLGGVLSIAGFQVMLFRGSGGRPAEFR